MVNDSTYFLLVSMTVTNADVKLARTMPVIVSHEDCAPNHIADAIKALHSELKNESGKSDRHHYSVREFNMADPNQAAMFVQMQKLSGKRCVPMVDDTSIATMKYIQSEMLSTRLFDVHVGHGADFNLSDGYWLILECKKELSLICRSSGSGI